MTIEEELKDLADELRGQGWRDVCPRTGTPAQQAARDRWMARMDRIDPAGHSRRMVAEVEAWLHWPQRAMRADGAEAGPDDVVHRYEALTRAELEEDPDLPEALRRCPTRASPCSKSHTRTAATGSSSSAAIFRVTCSPTSSRASQPRRDTWTTGNAIRRFPT